jgi:hypothetical protein
MKKTIIDLFLKKSEMTATATINGETHELSMTIGGNNLVNEPLKPIKEHQYFYYCHVTDEFIEGKKYALTVVSKFDLKRYYDYGEPNSQELIERLVDITSIGLDGNGVPVTGWHQRRVIDEVKKETDGAFMDRLLKIYHYFEQKVKNDYVFKVKPQNITDIECNRMLVCEQNVNIPLDDEFMKCIEEISIFTRENDTTFPYSVISDEMSQFDNIRTAIGAVSMFLPVGKAYKLTQEVISYIADIISASSHSLALPASKLFDLRGPVKLSKVTKDMYENEGGRTYEQLEWDPILKRDVEKPIYELKTTKKIDEIEIYY